MRRAASVTVQPGGMVASGNRTKLVSSEPVPVGWGPTAQVVLRPKFLAGAFCEIFVSAVTGNLALPVTQGPAAAEPVEIRGPVSPMADVTASARRQGRI